MVWGSIVRKNKTGAAPSLRAVEMISWLSYLPSITHSLSSCNWKKNWLTRQCVTGTCISISTCTLRSHVEIGMPSSLTIDKRANVKRLHFLIVPLTKLTDYFSFSLHIRLSLILRKVYSIICGRTSILQNASLLLATSLHCYLLSCVCEFAFQGFHIGKVSGMSASSSDCTPLWHRQVHVHAHGAGAERPERRHILSYVTGRGRGRQEFALWVDLCRMTGEQESTIL